MDRYPLRPTAAPRSLTSRPVHAARWFWVRPQSQRPWPAAPVLISTSLHAVRPRPAASCTLMSRGSQPHCRAEAPFPRFHTAAEKRVHAAELQPMAHIIVQDKWTEEGFKAFVCDICPLTLSTAHSNIVIGVLDTILYHCPADNLGFLMVACYN